MKKIIKYILLAPLFIGLSSCDSFFELDTYQNIPTEEAYNSVQDVRNGATGAYRELGSYGFYGNYVVAIGDMASDLAIASSSSGHFVDINIYNIDATNGEIEDAWTKGYAIIDKCVRTIKGSKELIAKKDEEKITDADLAILNLSISQCYGLKALSTFTLTNIFGLPYQAQGGNTQLGVCLLEDEPLEPFVDIKRSSVEDCYTQVLANISEAKKHLNEAKTLDSNVKYDGEEQFYMNEAAIYALEARVKLFMSKYSEAKVAAQKAIDLRASGEISNESYVKMWSSLAITDEDIFSIAKTADDNLSANALNTLYGSYKGKVSSKTEESFADTDTRKAVLEVTAYKYQGLGTSQATSNIHVFRKSEMKLIVAECEARLNNLSKAKEALLFTAKRNTAIQSINDLPNTKEDLLSFILEERIRELYLEGFRWYDVRRTGEKIKVNGHDGLFDASKFVYPIPKDEINAGFMDQQNEGWHENLPGA